MAEIFTSPAGGQGAATAQISDDLRLTAPSDVYFGPATPGIAFYEKTGADLAVTLLDGEMVTIRNFFAIGESGEYSRLLLGPGGEAELTGLVAPEPFVPPTDEPVMIAEVEPAPPPPAPTPAPATEVVAQPAPVVDAQPEVIAETAPTASEGGFFGFNPEHLLFAAANIPILIALASSDDDDPDDRPASPVEQAAMDPETAEMVEGIFADSDVSAADSAGFVDAAPIEAAFDTNTLLDDLSGPVDAV